MKKCTKCLEYKDLNMFHKEKCSSDGHRSDCKVCKNSYRNSVRDKEKSRKQATEWRLNNLERVKDNKRKYKAREAELAKVRRLKNLDKIRKQTNEYAKNRRKNDKVYSLAFKMRCVIANHLRVKGYNKKSKTSQILGCAFEELKSHLESTFYVNYGVEFSQENYEVEVDHIVPISTAKTEEDVLKLNHYTNLQYLLKVDNRNKKDKTEYTLTRIL